MIIRNMFADNINRPINGVIQVEQNASDVIEQEVREYVITKELKKHFMTFFNNYSDAFTTPTNDTGVWISGFFGSGKSHFLKMLSYILENKEVGGKKTVEYFREKFADDPATFMLVDNATKGETETILFNIDIEGSMNKDKTAVLRVFAKMFYNHLGFYGENLKIAMLEKYIEESGKTEEFRRVFAEKKGKSWLDQRKAFAFNGKVIVPTLMEVLDMSEEDAQSWFRDKSSVEFSISQLVNDIKEYVDSKPGDFRLLFMVDEAGQYVGTDTDMLLNLQSLVEQIGSVCGGKVWVCCTGQEAIDDVIKVRQNEFSRIQARFKTRLSLTSSSVDEVIQKRILRKTPEAEKELEALYNENDSVLRNLYSFSQSVLDIKGFSGPKEFSVNFPFVPYQFIIMQKVFNEIRKHGNSGKHQSSGERSMLSGFQDAAKMVQECDEYTLVPFFRFYDSLHSFLDSPIRRVIERCQRAADNEAGIEAYDVSVLKLLYLIRYIDDITSNLDNITILMADDIRTDKIVLREKVRDSLNRLHSQNYIGRSEDTYRFLTDEEQDIQKEINLTQVEPAKVVERIGQLIFGDIYTTKKYRYDIYDFDFDKMVDSTNYGTLSGGMKLRFMTIASDPAERVSQRLMYESKGQAIVVLAETPYYESIENAMKIRKYVKQRNVAQLPKTQQEIISRHQEAATTYDDTATESLKKAIENAEFYVDGEYLTLRGTDPKSKLDQAMEYLVVHVYSELDLIAEHVSYDSDIIQIATSTSVGDVGNVDAAAKVEEYLLTRFQRKLPTTMSDVQSRYQAVPYGWKEIDIAAVVALLVHDQKVTLKYAGNTVQPTDPRLPDLLRKRSEIGRTQISIRQAVSAANIKEAREFLREYFDRMDIPTDEDALIAYIVDHFTAQKSHYESLLQRYDGHRYPDQNLLQAAVTEIKELLSQQKDNVALITKLIKMEDTFYDRKDSLQNIEDFFQNQVTIFDGAVQYWNDLLVDKDYLSEHEEAYAAFNKINLYTRMETGVRFNYKRIPELGGLVSTVRQTHDALLEEKRKELYGIIQDCQAAIRRASKGDRKAQDVLDKADDYYSYKQSEIAKTKQLVVLDGIMPQLWIKRDDYVASVEIAIAPPVVQPEKPPKETPPKPPKRNRNVYRQAVFPAETLSSEEEIDAYLEKVRDYMLVMLRGYDGIKLN